MFSDSSVFQRSVGAVIAVAAAVGMNPRGAQAVDATNFNEAGTVVNGFQDDFSGNTLTAGWTEVGSDAATNFALSGAGVLNLLPATGDPNKLLYNGASYDVDDQNILARIRVTDPNPPANNGFWRGGVATASSAANGQGINALFKTPGSEGAGNHVQLLNDTIAWGDQIPEGDFQWVVGEWYWLRLIHEGDNDATIRIWPADNVTPESAADTVSMTNFGDRDGLAGLVTNSGANGTFEVDYVLIQAEGLPAITVVPEPASIGLLALSGLGLLARRRMI